MRKFALAMRLALLFGGFLAWLYILTGGNDSKPFELFGIPLPIIEWVAGAIAIVAGMWAFGKTILKIPKWIWRSIRPKRISITPFEQLELGEYVRIWEHPFGGERKYYNLPGILLRNGLHEQKIVRYWIEDENEVEHHDFFVDPKKLPIAIAPNERRELVFTRTRHSPSPAYTSNVRGCVQLDSEHGKVIRSEFIPLSRIKHT